MEPLQSTSLQIHHSFKGSSKESLFKSLRPAPLTDEGIKKQHSWSLSRNRKGFSHFFLNSQITQLKKN